MSNRHFFKKKSRNPTHSGSNGTLEPKIQTQNNTADALEHSAWLWNTINLHISPPAQALHIEKSSPVTKETQESKRVVDKSYPILKSFANRAQELIDKNKSWRGKPLKKQAGINAKSLCQKLIQHYKDLESHNLSLETFKEHCTHAIEAHKPSLRHDDCLMRILNDLESSIGGPAASFKNARW